MNNESLTEINDIDLTQVALPAVLEQLQMRSLLDKSYVALLDKILANAKRNAALRAAGLTA